MMDDATAWVMRKESEDLLLWAVLKQKIDPVCCPTCGSVFLLHVCHARWVPLK